MEKIYAKVTAKQFATRLAKVGKTSKQLQEELHSLAMTALYHLNVNTNSTMASDLLTTVLAVKSQRGQALKAWFAAFGACNFEGDIIKFKNKKEIRSPEKMDSVLEKADAMPFWELTKEEAKKPIYSLAAKLLQDIKIARKIQSDEETQAKFREVDLDEELLDKIEILVLSHLREHAKDEQGELIEELGEAMM